MCRLRTDEFTFFTLGGMGLFVTLFLVCCIRIPGDPNPEEEAVAQTYAITSPGPTSPGVIRSPSSRDLLKKASTRDLLRKASTRDLLKQASKTYTQSEVSCEAAAARQSAASHEAKIDVP